MIISVSVGDHEIGPGRRTFVVAEIGINHNGNLALAKELITAAKDCGADAVKFQKRTVDIVYSPDELAMDRESPFGTKNGDLKRGLEFGVAEYTEIDNYCSELGIIWTASCWDEGSVDFIQKFQPPFFKIASASLTDDDLLKHHRNYPIPVILSTGMSTIEQIDHAVKILGKNDLVLLHCTSTYPSEPKELNLRAIAALEQHYQIPIGYSGHEVIFIPSFAAAVMGACVIERHLTLDRAMWGSDQAASLEPMAFQRMVKYIRGLEEMMGDGKKRVYESELPIIKKLRRK